MSGNAFNYLTKMEKFRYTSRPNRAVVPVQQPENRTMKTDPVLTQLAALKAASIAEIKAQWRDLFCEEPPAFNRRYLESRLAYRVQELAYGGLKPATVKRLQQLGEQLDGGNITTRRVRADLKPIVGTRLIREWQIKLPVKLEP